MSSIKPLLLTVLLAAGPAAVAGELAPPSGKVLLVVSGNVGNPNVEDEAHFDRDMLEGLGQTEVRTSTPWTDGQPIFKGVLIRDILAAAAASGETVRATALNDYSVEIPTADFARYDVIAALRKDDVYLKVRNKGPLWIIYPRDEFANLQDSNEDYKWIWQLKTLVVE